MIIPPFAYHLLFKWCGAPRLRSVDCSTQNLRVKYCYKLAPSSLTLCFKACRGLQHVTRITEQCQSSEGHPQTTCCTNISHSASSVQKDFSAWFSHHLGRSDCSGICMREPPPLSACSEDSGENWTFITPWAMTTSSPKEVSLGKPLPQLITRKQSEL